MGTGGFSAVIAGGGVAALEAAAALGAQAGERLTTTLIAPEAEFVYRPLVPQQALRGSEPPRLPLADLAQRAGAHLIRDRIGSVDRGRMWVQTRSGERVRFDALILCLGAVATPCFPDAITIDGRAAATLGEVFDEIRSGATRSLALLVPLRSAWPLPLYEVALMSAGLAAERGRDLEVVIATAEQRPLEIFGDAAAVEMGALLAEHGIRVVPAAHCEHAESHRVLVNGRDGATVTLTPDRVLALPQLLGPHLRGVPSSENGFIPIDRYCAVRGTERIYAAGDATDYPVKHGGLAAQQADVAAATVAALAGAPVVPRPFRPTLEGLLLTGGQPRYLTARLTGATPFGSQMRAGGSAVPEPKIVAPHLTDLLNRAGG